MIPQFFVKSSGEQINFSKFDYVSGATLVYDWGNPVSYNPGQGAGGVTSNVYNSGAPQGQFIAAGAPTTMWSNAYTGSIQFNSTNKPYVEYNGTLPTGAISIVSIYKPDELASGSLLSLTGSQNGINLVVAGATRVVTPTIWYGAGGNTQATLTCAITMSNSANNGWNMVTFASNGLDSHTMYLDSGSIQSTDTNTYDRGLFSPVARNIRIGMNNINSGNNQTLNGVMIATLIYPFKLSQKQIRQLWYVFRQRMTVS